MANKTTRDLRQHLCLFDPEYPIKKGFVARLLLDQAHVEVFKEVVTVVRTAEPDKRLNEINLSDNLHRFKEIFEDKHSTCEWSSLTRFFIEPFPVAFDNFPILIDHLQPVLKSEAASSSKPTVTPDYSRASSPDVEIIEISFNHPPTPVNSFVSSPPRSPSPWKSDSDSGACVETQFENMTLYTAHDDDEEDTPLRTQLGVLNMPIYEKEEHSKNSLKRLHDMVKKKARAAYIWKDKYAALSSTTKFAQRKWQMLQILEEKVRVLEEELCRAQAEIERLNEIIRYQNRKLKAENCGEIDSG